MVQKCGFTSFSQPLSLWAYGRPLLAGELPHLFSDLLVRAVWTWPGLIQSCWDRHSYCSSRGGLQTAWTYSVSWVLHNFDSVTGELKICRLILHHLFSLTQRRLQLYVASLKSCGRLLTRQWTVLFFCLWNGSMWNDIHGVITRLGIKIFFLALHPSGKQLLLILFACRYLGHKQQSRDTPQWADKNVTWPHYICYTHYNTDFVSLLTGGMLFSRMYAWLTRHNGCETDFTSPCVILSYCLYVCSCVIFRCDGIFTCVLLPVHSFRTHDAFSILCLEEWKYFFPNHSLQLYCN